jgi:inosose dehydratase
MEIGYHAQTWGSVAGHPAGVTSIKDLFYVTGGDMTVAAREIGQAGYAGTEMFDGDLQKHADEPSTLRDALSAAGVELVSVYAGANFIYPDVLDDELWRITRACELANMFGAERLVVGGGSRRATGTTDGDYTLLGEGLTKVVEIAAAHGLDATYHPHLGTIVESPDELRTLMDRTSIGFCPDTAHLAAGGGDPAAVIRAHGDRVRHVHLKDIDMATGRFLPLGSGDLDFADILHAIKETGYDSWLMVELDYYEGHPKDAAEISKAYLHDLLSHINA